MATPDWLSNVCACQLQHMTELHKYGPNPENKQQTEIQSWLEFKQYETPLVYTQHINCPIVTKDVKRALSGPSNQSVLHAPGTLPVLRDSTECLKKREITHPWPRFATHYIPPETMPLVTTLKKNPNPTTTKYGCSLYSQSWPAPGRHPAEILWTFPKCNPI